MLNFEIGSTKIEPGGSSMFHINIKFDWQSFKDFDTDGKRQTQDKQSRPFVGQKL